MKLGRFDIDTDARCLLLNGERVRLGARAFDILVMLVSAGGRLVSRNELMQAVWPGVIVEDCNIDVHISALRRALGPDRELIVTVSGRGYRCAQSRPTSTAKPACVSDSTHLRLPARPATLHGRTETIGEITGALRCARLVTVVGMGGVGKTSVAVEVAHATAPEFGYRVMFVDLASLSDPAAIPGAIARECLGKIDTTQADASVASIAAQLPAQPCLLVLDNAEHLVCAVADLVERLIALNDTVRVLVTSREPLLIRQERLIRVEPLAIPDWQASDAELSNDASVQCFLDYLGRGSTLSHGDASAIRTIAEICRRLDGLPLAIELAAKRAALLGIDGVHRRLGDRLALLTGGYRNTTPRHRTLHATFDASFVLLSDTARRLFERLSVFNEAFSFDAIPAAVCDLELSEDCVLDAIDELVAKSLVNVRIESSEASYHLIESVRAFAASKLREATTVREAVPAKFVPLRAAA